MCKTCRIADNFGIHPAQCTCDCHKPRFRVRDILWDLSDLLCSSRYRWVREAGHWAGELGWLLR